MNSAATFVQAPNPRRKLYSTIIICVGALFTALALPGDVVEIEVYRFCAYAMFVVLGLAFAVEGSGGIKSLVRVDIVAIFCLYFLTYAEFLHPEVKLLYEYQTGAAATACWMVNLSFVGIALGRHFEVGKSRQRSGQSVSGTLPELSPTAVGVVFILFAFLGYFYVLLMMNFNVFDVIDQLMRPRFARPWQRGAQGDWRSALTELSLLLYVVSAMGGYIFANARRFSLAFRAVAVAILLFMTFFDFAEGARNVIMIKVGLFMVAYFLSSHARHSVRTIALSVGGIIALWVVSGYMLRFRNQGLGNFIEGGYVATGFGADDPDGFMIDNNMVSIARVAELFPSMYPLPGSEVVVQVFTKWVPRFLWPDKPIDWSIGLDDAFGTGGYYTIALTYVGEAYMIAGMPSVFIVSLLLGMLAASWTRVGLSARSNLDLIYYASGFYAAALGMRSIQFITIAMVPTFALFIFGKYLANSQKRPRLQPVA